MPSSKREIQYTFYHVYGAMSERGHNCEKVPFLIKKCVLKTIFYRPKFNQQVLYVS